MLPQWLKHIVDPTRKKSLCVGRPWWEYMFVKWAHYLAHTRTHTFIHFPGSTADVTMGLCKNAQLKMFLVAFCSIWGRRCHPFLREWVQSSTWMGERPPNTNSVRSQWACAKDTHTFSQKHARAHTQTLTLCRRWQFSSQWEEVFSTLLITRNERHCVSECVCVLGNSLQICTSSSPTSIFSLSVKIPLIILISTTGDTTSFSKSTMETVSISSNINRIFLSENHFT